MESFQTIGLTIITPILSSKTTSINVKRALITQRNKILMVFTLDTEENAKRLADYFGVAPVKPPVAATFPITGAQLKEIFPTTDQSRCDEVAEIINKYFDKFEINTPLRMAHFLGQIGWESAQLKAMGEKSGEGTCYKKASAGWSIWFSLTWKETPFNNDCSDAPDDSQKSQKIKKNGWSSINDVPKKYICDAGEVDKAEAGKNLFCYVYRCEGGNGDENSCDGYRYRGHGIMQLTWKKQYESFNKWLISQGFDNDYKQVLTDPDEGFKDKDIDVLSGLWFWNKNNCNEEADKLDENCSDSAYKDFTLLINKGADKYLERKKLFKTSHSTLKLK